MNPCQPSNAMQVHMLLGALIVLCNAVSAYVVVKTREKRDAETSR